MAVLHFQITSISRGAGRSAVAAAAYRSGERLRDERTGRLHNYTRRTDIQHKEIMLPAGLDAGRIAWVRDRSRLWNIAAQVETRQNARLAREFQVALPHELRADQRRELARSFSQQMADRYRVVVDLAIHAPRPDGDPRNHHAHLLLTSREITAEGFAGKAGLDMSTPELRRRGLPVGIAEIRAVREQWAALANEALLKAGFASRVDHRSLRAQGIDRPIKHLPYGHFKRLRRALRAEVVARVGEHHQARLQARNAELAKVPEAAVAVQAAESGIDAIRRQAREAWQSLRDSQANAGEQRPTPEPTLARDVRDQDHDHEL